MQLRTGLLALAALLLLAAAPTEQQIEAEKEKMVGITSCMAWRSTAR